MNKILTIILVISIGIFFGLIGYGFSQQKTSQQLGGFLVSTITNASSSIGMTDTLVYSPSNLQFFYAINRGGGNVDCTWTTTSTLTGASLNTGLRFEDANLTTSTEKSHIITDQNLLAKYMHCIANTTTSLNILKY